MIDHKQNGYLAKYCNVEDLADGIAETITTAQNNKQLQSQARQKALDNYAYPVVAKKMQDLYTDLLKC